MKRLLALFLLSSLFFIHLIQGAPTLVTLDEARAIIDCASQASPCDFYDTDIWIDRAAPAANDDIFSPPLLSPLPPFFFFILIVFIYLKED
jgi:hypothetical protein